MPNSPLEPPARPEKLKAHRGELMTMLGILCLFITPLILAPITWWMAHNDLKEMDAGRMDPAGRQRTLTARLLAIISTLTWPLVMSCCCVGTVANQFIQGGRLVSAIGSRRITRNEFQRVNHDMSKKQVTEILGPPARREFENGQETWYWYEKSGPAKFSVTFTERGAGALGVFTPD